MTIAFALVFTTLHLEDDHLVTFNKWVNHFTNNFRTLYCRGSYFNSSLVVYEKHFVKLYSLTFFSILDMVNEQFLALFNLKLLTVNFYNCVHFVI